MHRVIEIDTRQQDGKHKLKHEHFAAAGYATLRTKLPFGDYRFVGGLWTVDTKQGIGELATNLHQGHDRFHRECEGAASYGYKLVVLVENELEIKSLADLEKWMEPFWHQKKRRGKKRLSGKQLAKACQTMHERYGVFWAFCSPRDAGRRVIEILEGGENLGRDADA